MSEKGPYTSGVRRHGWGGDIPKDDEEAKDRILQAARSLLAQTPHRAPTVADVADALSISRPTVYRYFPTALDLVIESTKTGVDAFLVEIAEHLAAATLPADAVVEGIAFTYEQIATRPDFALALSTGIGRPDSITSPFAISLGRSILDHLPIDWGSLGFERDTLDELAELMLRTLQSMLLDPGDPPRSAQELRAYLHRWVGGAVNYQLSTG